MCGIVGFITTGTTFDVKKADFLEQALYVDALRGRHSTGVFTVENNLNAYYNKDKVDAQRFLDDGNCRRYVRSVDSGIRAVVGHNRFATQGGKGIESAHPFLTEHVTLVHNGTLRGAWRADFPEHPKANVDSARIAQALSKGRVGGKAVMEQVEGAYVFVWYDNRNQSMYIVRNDERPLSYLVVDNTMYYASERKMLEWIIQRTGIHAEPVAASFKTGCIYRWALKDKALKVEKPRVVKYTPFTPPVQEVVAWEAQARDWGRSGNHAVPAKGGSGPSTIRPAEKGVGNNKDALTAQLHDLGIDIKYNDTVEVQGGELQPYRKGSTTGCTLGWFDPVDLDGIDDHFDGVLYADVHHIPILTTEQIKKGQWHDSYYARVVGVANNQPDWMGKKDVLLTTIYEEVAARTEYKGDWKGYLKETFKAMRLKYQKNDNAKHECGKELLTNKEIDYLTSDMKCVGCDIPADMVNRSDISLNAEGTKFQCPDCVHKELDGNKETAVLTA